MSLVCGDRKGSLHVYHCDTCQKDKAFTSSQSFYGAHGPNGVTNVIFWNDAIYSVGRDGNCREYSILEDYSLVERNRFCPVRGTEWIDKIGFTERLGLMAIGFHGSEFILYSSTRKRAIFTTTCGGGHRSYALSSLTSIMESGRVKFAYIKGADVYLKQENISNQFLNPVLQEPFLGREAVSMCQLSSINDTAAATGLFAVGSEDCSIALVAVVTTDREDCSLSLRCLGTLQEHISAVQSLTCVRSETDDSVLLFSGGGRASLKAWLISTRNIETLAPSLQCEYNLHNLPSRPQRRKKRNNSIPPECRITCLTSFSLAEVNTGTFTNPGTVCVIAGCSDGFIRIYLYGQKSFTLLDNIEYHHRCILSVNHVILSSLVSHSASVKTVLFISAATDGRLVIWNLSPLFERLFAAVVLKEESTLTDSLIMQPLLTVDCHQSGINDVALHVIESLPPSVSLLLASVGDDNGLTLTLCCLSCDCHMTVTRQTRVPSSHFSAAIAVQILSSNSILTTSVDQRLSQWSVSDTITAVIKEKDYIHDIIDPACLLAYQMKDRYYAVVCGVGMECLQLGHL